MPGQVVVVSLWGAKDLAKSVYEVLLKESGEIVVA